MRPDVKLSGGRSGQRVKELTGPPNNALRGSGDRVYVTDENGRVILDVTPERAKPVKPGKGFGKKRAPTEEELGMIRKMHRKE
jgi:hypothetical protein